MQAVELTAASPAVSALISAFDSMNKSHSAPASASVSPLCHQYGENNHIEYKAFELSNTNASVSTATLQEKIMQFHFQLVRTSDTNTIQCIAKDTRNILSAIMSGISKNSYNNHGNNHGNNIDENDFVIYTRGLDNQSIVFLYDYLVKDAD
jgi:hypothetical protein